MASLFSELYTAAERTFSRVNAEEVPAKSVTKAVIKVIDGEYGTFRNVCFHLKSGEFAYAKVSKESEFYLADDGEEVPVSGEIFRLEDSDGVVTKTIYWEEA